MKKVTALLMTAAMTMSLIGCGASESEPAAAAPEPAAEESASETTNTEEASTTGEGGGYLWHLQSG